MTIPDYQTLMLPLMEVASDGAEHECQRRSRHSPSASGSRPPNGRRYFRAVRQTTIANRIGWS